MMIEQVARGMAAQGARHYARSDAKAFAEQYPAGASQYVDTHWHQYVEFARAAVEAMRLPTEAMVQAGGGPDALARWAAMIDAALAEPSPVMMINLA